MSGENRSEPESISPPPEPRPDLNLIGCRRCGRTGEAALRPHHRLDAVVDGVLIFIFALSVGYALARL